MSPTVCTSCWTGRAWQPRPTARPRREPHARPPDGHGPLRLHVGGRFRYFESGHRFWRRGLGFYTSGGEPPWARQWRPCWWPRRFGRPLRGWSNSRGRRQCAGRLTRRCVAGRRSTAVKSRKAGSEPVCGRLRTSTTSP